MNEFEITPQFKKAAVEAVKEFLRLFIAWGVSILSVDLAAGDGLLVQLYTDPKLLIAQLLPMVWKAGDKFRFVYQKESGDPEPKGLLPTFR